jgi:hypothetical protein
MRNKLLSTAVITAFTFLTACGPTTDEAVKYNDSIIGQMDPVITAEDALLDALEKGPDEMAAAHKAMIDQINKSIEEVKKMAKFDGKTELADAAIKYFEVYKSAVEVEYKKMIDVLSKPVEESTDADDEAYSKALDEVDKKLNAASAEFDAFQADFGKRYNYTIDKK